LTSKHSEDFCFVETVRVPNRNFIQKGEREIYITSMPLGFGYPGRTKAKEETEKAALFFKFVRDA
jgi:hypothetical protein